jgi:hypothetical protein
MTKQIKINRKDNIFEYDGKTYPPTLYNAEVVRRWQMAEDKKKEKIAKMLSEAVLKLEESKKEEQK